MATTYKIGEAAALLNLKTYVLRFWETEFPEISPRRTAKGQRLYTAEHLALLDRIRYLLHERGLTIGGARKVLAEEKARNVSYVFGAHGAVKGLDAEAKAERTADGGTAVKAAQPEKKSAAQRDGDTKTNGAGGAQAPAKQAEEQQEEAQPDKTGRPDKKDVPDAADAPDAADVVIAADLPEAKSEAGAGGTGEDSAAPDKADEQAEPDEPDDADGDDDTDEAREYFLNADQPPAFYSDPAQYNLPGLVAPALLRVSMAARNRGLDSESVEGYGGGESAPLAEQAGPQASLRGMLPLFAVAKAAFMAGITEAAQDADPGGGNFIQPGAGPALAGGAAASVNGEDLKAIAGELQAIAELLRAPANSAKGGPA